MKYAPLFVSVIAITNALSIENLVNFGLDGIPSKEEAGSIARTLVHRESLMNVNTASSDDQGSIPVSAMEYYADCDGNGDPYWLVVDIGSTYQNILKGSAYSFTIRVGDHPLNDYVNPEYPGGISNSPAGSPRLNLKGRMKDVKFTDPAELVRIEKCFLKRHPDAKWWLPTNVVSPHKTHWVKVEVDDVYMVGGFGDRAYIGNIDKDTYHSSPILE